METLIYLETELSWQKALLKSSDNIDDDYKYQTAINQIQDLITAFKVEHPELRKMKLVA